MIELHQKVRRIEIAAKRHVQDLFSGMYASAFKGRGIEVEEVREFQTGDDFRAIDWAKTAQLGRPYVKNFRQERDLTVMLVADVSGSLSYGSHYETKRERLTEVAALLAFSAIFNHDRVGLMLFSDKVEKMIHPKRGLRHGARLIRELLGFEPTSRRTDIAKALDYFNQALKKRCICFLLSDFLASGYEPPLALAAKKDDLVLIRIVDPDEAYLQEGIVSLQDIETGANFIVDVGEIDALSYTEAWKSHEMQLKDIAARYGQDRVEIDTKSAFLAKMIAFFKERKRRLS